MYPIYLMQQNFTYNNTFTTIQDFLGGKKVFNDYIIVLLYFTVKNVQIVFNAC